MTTYIKLKTLEYPRYEGDIRLEHPEIGEEVTGSDFPCPSTYAVVEWVDAPEINDYQIAYAVEPVQENGIWKMVWAVRNLTEDEIQRSIAWNAQIEDKINRP